MTYIKNKKIWTITNPKKNKNNINNKLNKILWIITALTGILSIFLGIYFPIFKNNNAIIILKFSTFIAMLTIIKYTKEGNKFWYFLKSSKIEINKINWPKKKEIASLTIIILIAIIITSIIIYSIGLIFIYIIKNILSH